MSSRDVILARIEHALADAPAVPEIPRNYHGAGEEWPSPGTLIKLLTDRLEDYRAAVITTDPEGLGAAIERAIEGARRIVVPAGLDPVWLPAAIEAVRDEGLTASELDGFDTVVTGARLAIAQTGTIVLDGGRDQGRRAITLVPDRHICVLRTDQVVNSVPDAVAQLDPTRPQTWISGPSATSDIELDRVEGVHGPRKLTVILVTV